MKISEKMDSDDEQINLLKQINKTLGGENIPDVPSATRFLYCDATHLAEATALLLECGISSTYHDSLQSGVYEYVFGCSEEQFQILIQRVIQRGIAVYITEKRLPIAGSIGSVAVVATMTDTKVGSTDGTATNAKYLRVDATDHILLGVNSGVDVGDVTINNSTGGSAVNIQDGGNTITVDGTVNATCSATHLDIRHLNTTDDTVVIADGGNTITVDGTVNATCSATHLDIRHLNVTDDAVVIADGGNTITVDGSVTATVSATHLDIRHLNTTDDALVADISSTNNIVQDKSFGGGGHLTYTLIASNTAEQLTAQACRAVRIRASTLGGTCSIGLSNAVTGTIYFDKLLNTTDIVDISVSNSAVLWVYATLGDKIEITYLT